jgi:hypothetical protein
MSIDPPSEDGQLSTLLLFPPLEVQAEDCLIHHPCQEKDLLDLLNLGYSAELVPESNGDLGFEEFCLRFFAVC